MAILQKSFLTYLSKVLTESMNIRKPAYVCDPLFMLLEACGGEYLEFSNGSVLTEKELREASGAFSQNGIVGVMNYYFGKGVLDQLVDEETERQIVALKNGFPRLPSTTCSLIMRGFGNDLSELDILRIYASHGLAQGMKELSREYDFVEINRRSREFSHILENAEKQKEFIKRYEAMHGYIQAPVGGQERAIRESGVNRSLFFHYWKRFCRYGLLGLADSGKELFRNGKIGMKNEARIVVGKLQNPNKKTVSFADMLATKNIDINPSSISMIFKRWKIKTFKSKFADNLQRLENDFQEAENEVECLPTEKPVRFVDEFYLPTLEGMSSHGMPTDSPGLFILWAYLEKLGIFPVLSQMGLAALPEHSSKGYSWLDLLLLNIGRIFYGISSHSATCEHPEPTLPFFAGLIKAPCKDTFLDGLENKITEKETFKLRGWLVKKAYELGLVDMKKTALDFHQIDMDVIFDKIRNFGKGPSPNKKICYNGFRPHIAWDVGTGCLIAAEFRKSSARGTTTAMPFIKDFMLPEFSDLFETIYIDSEYTGKNVWQFILDPNGMNAAMTACLKQNALVKRERDTLLKKHQNDHGFWRYYDDDHVYSSKTFDLSWESGEGRGFKLKCVVKKNTNNGSLRCFGSSKTQLDSTGILADYSNRWVIENGIKDLIGSYFIDNCPGTRPHLADVHFLVVSICRILFKLISDDLGDDGRNPDRTTKTLARMRERLFRQGAGKIFFRDNTFEVEFSNAFSPSMTNMLKKIFKKIANDNNDGLSILGGAKLKFSTRVPHGDEHRNSLEKVPFFATENF